jgi:hypothetical protein
VACNLKAENVNNKVSIKPGDYVVVKIEETYAHSLRGVPIARTSMTEYQEQKKIVI